MPSGATYASPIANPTLPHSVDSLISPIILTGSFQDTTSSFQLTDILGGALYVSPSANTNILPHKDPFPGTSILPNKDSTGLSVINQ